MPAGRPATTTLTGLEGSGQDHAAALALDAALATLEVDDREVFLLKELGGLSYAEIAAACDLTPAPDPAGAPEATDLTETHTAVLSAFLDNEMVDPEALGAALSDPDGRAALVDFARLRQGVTRPLPLPASLRTLRRRPVARWAAPRAGERSRAEAERGRPLAQYEREYRTGSADGTVATLDTLLARAAYVWRVTLTGVSYEAGRQTFDLDWARYAAASGTVPVASGKQRLTLDQDQTYPIDLLHNTSTDCRTASVVVQVTASVREDAARSDAVLHYDLWLVRHDASGRKQTQHFVMTGRQGAAVPFAFAALRADIPRVQSDQYDFELVTSVAGQLRGRVQPDGQVSVELTTSRQDRLQRRGAEDPSPSGFGAGRKILDVKAGEAVEIELPSRSGYSSH